jgi:transposase
MSKPTRVELFANDVAELQHWINATKLTERDCGLILYKLATIPPLNDKRASVEYVLKIKKKLKFYPYEPPTKQ